jgi:TRAP transporter 4TM/12TM fusion protein
MFVFGALIVLYGYTGENVQDILAHKGVSLKRLIGYQWLGGEAIFGIPIDVSVSFVFLFVLFGALLDKAGAGQYFLDMAFAMVGKYRGGPAKAAILASGMTGAISGSSIANVVTTGTFTIPVMKRTGLPAIKAGAIEVAASTNGQIMPPIMGAAAFIIAEFIGISYFEVVIAAIVPALTSYIALLYISHLEAMKLGLKGLPEDEIPNFWNTFVNGIHFLIPIVVLIYLLMVERWTASSAVFYSIAWMMLIVLGARVFPRNLSHALLFIPLSVPVLVSTVLRWVMGQNATDATVWGLAVAIAIIAAMAVLGRSRGDNVVDELWDGLKEIAAGMIAGARNMITIGVAVAAAGIIVGAVSSTGLNNALVGVVEAISGGNIYILLIMTAILCIVLGMGLPTTANYIVVASLLAGVVVELGGASGLVLPLIAVHLFVFYFGLMADSTPPVCLAAFAASAISRADPLKTGVQSFLYDIRTAVLPFIFIFNPEMLLIGIESWWHAVMIFVVSVIAIFCFSSVTQGWFIVKVKWYEGIALLVVMMALFRPDMMMNQFYPPFAPASLDKLAAGERIAPPAKTIRLHLTRETDYGDRLKLYRIATPEIPPDPDFGVYGVKFEAADDGWLEVVDLQRLGLAEQVGVEIGDYIREVDVEQVGMPSKQWVYPFGLALLGLVIAWQLRRRRREGPSAAATA